MSVSLLMGVTNLQMNAVVKLSENVKVGPEKSSLIDVASRSEDHTPLNRF